MASEPADGPPVDTVADLKVLLTSAYPLVLAEARDERRLLDALRRLAGELGLPLWTWSAARGLARDGHDPQYRTQDPRTALAFVADLSDPGIFVFADAHHALGDAVVLRSVKEAALRAERSQTLVLTAPHHDVPPELEGLAVRWHLTPPDEADLRRLVRRTVEDLAMRGMAVALQPSEESALAGALQGLTLGDAERLLQQAVLRDGGLTSEDVPYVRKAKVELLNTDGVLELVESQVGTLDDVGGLDGLKSWLAVRGAAMGSPRAAAMGIEAPRGVLLTGIPGCGKSLIAKSLAATWLLPLVLLDPSRIYRKFVGESEQRLATALETVGAMAPAVLWIDEIEKGFATDAGSDGGVSTRLLGTFLRWMQDRPDGVFIVATANDVSSLPPELLRKGRFDEVFFVDLPAPAARREIFDHHLRARGHDPQRFDVDKLVEITESFSGAEIEAIVVGALYRAFAAQADLTTEELIAEAEGTVPLSATRAEDVARLRAWATGRAVPA
jgi:SpoVK/Ycf46/Vps4 family AAA+-type ATPase